VAGAGEPAAGAQRRRRAALPPPGLSRPAAGPRRPRRNPEGAAPRGLWADPEFVREVYDRVNPLARHTQFADYHGHGWNFRAIFRRDREGNLVDADGQIIPENDPDTFRRDGEGLFVPVGTNPGRAVHMMDIHAQRGLQCADCHFSRDAHGNGFIQGEVANAIEIGCKDCHGTAREYANLRTSNVAAPPRGTNLELIRNTTAAAASNGPSATAAAC
jgi:hypothetical protein